MNNKKLVIYVVALALSLSACEKIDTDYKKYIGDSEVIYPGTPSEIIALSGYKRIQLRWNASPDPSVTKYIIYWNDYRDSATFNVPSGVMPSRFTGGIVENISEGIHFLTIHAFDKDNNKSRGIQVNNVRVYGDFYLMDLSNRGVSKTSVASGGTVKLTFRPAIETNIFTDVIYTSAEGNKDSVQVLPQDGEVTISNRQQGTTIRYRSAYKPAINVIDTFYVKQYSTLNVD